MYEIEEFKIRNEDILKAKFTGEFERNIVFQFIDMMSVYEDLYPNHKLLVDFTEVTKVLIDIKDIKSIVQYVKDHDKRLGKTAFVTGPDNGRYMIAKLFVDFVSVFRPNQKNSFKSMEKAADWLCPNSVTSHEMVS